MSRKFGKQQGGVGGPRDGGFFATWREPSGKQRYKAGFPTKQAARHFLDATLAEMNLKLIRGIYVEPRTITFERFAKTYLTQRVSIPASTLSGYASMNQKHLVPFFAKTRLQDISFETVQDFVIHLQEDFSPKMVRNCFGLLRTMLAGRKGKTALRQGFISHDPTQGVELPPKAERAIFPLAGGEIWKLIHAAEEVGPKEQDLVYLGAHTGARRGELLAFRYERIDWEKSRILIDQAVTRTKGTDGIHKWQWKLGTPKTRKSVRWVILSHDVLDYLQRMKANSAGTGFIFGGSRPGEFIDPDFLDVMFSKIRARANLPHHVRFHDLRHFFASFLIDQGFSAEYVRDQLGHSSIQSTSNITPWIISAPLLIN